MTRAMHRGTSIALAVLVVVSWLLAMAFSVVASPDYRIPVSLALACALLHFAAVAILVWRGTSWRRFGWLLLAAPLAIVTLDNLGRLSHILGGPLFRILI